MTGTARSSATRSIASRPAAVDSEDSTSSGRTVPIDLAGPQISGDERPWSRALDHYGRGHCGPSPLTRRSERRSCHNVIREGRGGVKAGYRRTSPLAGRPWAPDRASCLPGRVGQMTLTTVATLVLIAGVAVLSPLLAELSGRVAVRMW